MTNPVTMAMLARSSRPRTPLFERPTDREARLITMQDLRATHQDNEAQRAKAAQIQQLAKESGGDLEKFGQAVMTIDPQLGNTILTESQRQKDAKAARDRSVVTQGREDAAYARTQAEQTRADAERTASDRAFATFYADYLTEKGLPKNALSEVQARVEFKKLGQAPKLHNVPAGNVVLDENDPTSPLYTAPAATPPPRVPVPGTDIPLPADVEAQRLRITQQGRAPADERLVQIAGPQGTPIWVRESEAVGKPAAQAARAVTGQERQALAFYNRAQQAVDLLTTPGADGNSLEIKMAKQGTLRQVQGQRAPNLLQTSEQQAYRQAQRAFTEARLRKESGAAIPNAEYENDAKTYFVQPGDDPATVEQKRAARQTVLEGLRFGAGRAYDEYYGEPAPKPADSNFSVTAPDGKTYEFPTKAKADEFKRKAGIR